MAIRCPRCHRDAPDLTAFCAGCGAPLLLPDDEPRRSLDAPVDLDRRSRMPVDEGATPPEAAPVRLPGPAATTPARRAPAPPTPGPPPRAPHGPRAPGLAPVEPSHWDLRPLPAAVGSEPAGPSVAVPERNVAEPLPPAPSAAAPRPHAEAPTEPGPDGDVPDPDVDALEVHVARSEPWRRVVAWAVDGVPFLAAGCALGWSLLREAAAGRPVAPGGIEELVELVARERVIALSVAAAVAIALATYATLAHALAGATLGKRLVGIRVVGPDGGPPSFARSALRAIFSVVSAALFGAGFLLALFTRTGRALHDLLARTWVVKAP